MLISDTNYVKLFVGIDSGDVIKGPAKNPLSFLPVEKRQNDPGYVVTT